MRPYFFGYGSLVHTGTHDYPDPRPARVRGWRRKWRHTEKRNVAYLTVHAVKGAEIEGMIAHVPGSNWVALDQREAAYDRLKLHPDHIDHDHPDEIDIQIYRTRSNEDAAPSVRHPILQSYLDTVAAGYFRHFGHDGLCRFFETTDGWDAPILEDRSEPVYPRSQRVSPDLLGLVDALLDTKGARRMSLAAHQSNWAEGRK